MSSSTREKSIDKKAASDMGDSATIIRREEIIRDMIFIIRCHKVMIDSDLAGLYGVPTKQLKRAVRRNIGRFPDDFMFELTREEFENLRCQFGASSWGGERYLPYVFTEQGVAMLSSVLHSEKAIRVNIDIMRTFTRLRTMIASNKHLKRKVDEMEKKYDKQFRIVFTALKQLLDEPVKPKKPIGFHP
jgi:hypothetical protein